MKAPLRQLDAREFERLADQTRLGAKAREMARLTLVEGQSMHDVAKAFATIPQRVCLAVGSIHRVQAAITWASSATSTATVPDRLLLPLNAFVSSVHALKAGQIDDAVIADLQQLLSQARERIARL